MGENIPIFYPKNKSESFFKLKNSKFYGFLIPCSHVEEAENEIKRLKKVYYDATHVCYAFQIGFQNTLYRANDDGEPTYSAGIPIYRKIVAYQVSNILIAVVRYFGGTKLGISGLIEAYETTAELALQNTQLTKYIPKVKLSFSISYHKTSYLYAVLRNFEHQFLQEQYNEENAFLEIEVNQEDEEKIIKILLNYQIYLQKF